MRLRAHFSCLRCSRCPRSRRTTLQRFLAARSHRSIRKPSLPAGASFLPAANQIMVFLVSALLGKRCRASPTPMASGAVVPALRLSAARGTISKQRTALQFKSGILERTDDGILRSHWNAQRRGNCHVNLVWWWNGSSFPVDEFLGISREFFRRQPRRFQRLPRGHQRE